MRKVYFCFTLIISLLNFSKAWAQQSWTSCNGPAGGYTTSMDTFANYLWVSTLDGGVYRSADNGATWEAHNQGITFGFLDKVNYLLSYGGKLFAATRAQGILMLASANGTWTSSTINTGGYSFSRLCKGTGAILALGGPNTVQRSTDNGATWQAANSGLPANISSQIFMETSAGYALIASVNSATQSVDVYRSVNDGSSWTPAASPGITSVFQFGCLKAIGNKIFINCSTLSSTPYPLMYTTDGGQNWNALPNTASVVANDLLYTNGSYKSVHGTAILNLPITSALTLINTPLIRKYNLDCHGFYRLGSSVFIMGDNLVKTDTTFSTFQFSNAGLNAAPLSFIEGNSSRIITQPSGNMLCASTDNGQSWMADSIAAYGIGVGLHSSTQNGSLWYIGGNTGGVYLSQNAGQTFRMINSGIPNYANNTGGSYPHINALVATPSGTVFAANYNELYVAQHDTLWVLKYAFPNGNGYGDPQITSLAANGTYLFAGTSYSGQGELYRSSDNGATWQTVSRNGDYHEVDALTILGNRLITSNLDSGIYTSNDWGGSWSRFDNGVTTTSGNAKAFVSLKNIGSKTYGVQAWDYHLYGLGAGSNVWENLTPLPTDPLVLSVWGSGDTVLYVGTKNSSVWKKRTTPPSTGWEPVTNVLQATLYPNPSAQPVLSLKNDCQLPATVQIYEIASGRLCAQQIVSAAQTKMNTSVLLPGNYLLDVRDQRGYVARLYWTKAD